MIELHAISYSPWSEKARWALDHHRLEYREVAYVPMLGEPLLRWRLRRLRGRITAPVLLLDRAEGIFDSIEIARYADQLGSGTTLFPPQHRGEIARWEQLADEAMQAGRVLVTSRMGRDSKAKRQSVPAFVPAPLRGMVATVGMRYLARKYRFGSAGEAAHRASFGHVLSELARALEGGRPTLLEHGFTFADIAMAAALHFVRPVDDRYVRMTPEQRTAWTDRELEQSFAPLLGWRDALYERYR